MFVKPAEGRTVRRPDTLVHLRSEGEDVPDHDLFWHRRLRDGDVIKVDPSDGDPSPVEQAPAEETHS